MYALILVDNFESWQKYIIDISYTNYTRFMRYEVRCDM